VRPGFVLTNNHVVPTAEAAAKTVVEFNFEEDADGRLLAHISYPVDANAPFVTSPVDKFDCTILKIAEVEGQPPVASWGTLELAYGQMDNVAVGAHVTIVQHPQGGPKKIAATANEVVNIFEHRLQYMTDTMGGSSGSPVFNDKWNVIAIHHAGGNIVKNAKGERFFANEGILFGPIMNVPEFRQILAP
jgi:endonuclease G